MEDGCTIQSMEDSAPQKMLICHLADWMPEIQHVGSSFQVFHSEKASLQCLCETENWPHSLHLWYYHARRRFKLHLKPKSQNSRQMKQVLGSVCFKTIIQHSQSL
jgi:hypothetical protein